MTTEAINTRLTQTSAGTPMGELLRRYWWPVASVTDLDKDPVQPVRLLSENLTLFRTERGELGMIGERCAHRGISLAYGIPQENGLRCAYHGWTYDTAGHVVDMPFEQMCIPFKIVAYPVEELGGLIWAYLGPTASKPLLPRLELLVRTEMARSVTIVPLPCNFLQCNDNSLDPVHFEHLHGHFANWWNKKQGLDTRVRPARHLKIDFDLFPYGIIKRRLEEGAPEDGDEWMVGHPFLFPHTLVQGSGRSYNLQIRVPIDDTNTLHFRYDGRSLAEGEELTDEVLTIHDPLRYDVQGRVEWYAILPQDYAAWTGQGPIADRTKEHLVTSDKGVIMYHNLLLENIEKVQRGEDPMFTIRNEAENTPWVQFPREAESWSGRRVEFSVSA